MKLLLASILLVFCLQDSALAQQNQIQALQDTVEILQRKVSQLENRVAELEKRLLANNRPKSESTIKSDLWKEVSNWRKLERGMSKDEVREILGEPENVLTLSIISTWSYPNGGSVSFMQGKVDGWMEP